MCVKTGHRWRCGAAHGAHRHGPARQPQARRRPEGVRLFLSVVGNSISGAVQPRCYVCLSRQALIASAHRVQDSTTDFAAQYKGDNDQGTPAQTGADASARPGANTPKGVGEIRNPKTPTLPNALGGRSWNTSCIASTYFKTVYPSGIRPQHRTVFSNSCSTAARECGCMWCVNWCSAEPVTLACKQCAYIERC